MRDRGAFRLDIPPAGICRLSPGFDPSLECKLRMNAFGFQCGLAHPADPIAALDTVPPLAYSGYRPFQP